MSQLMGVATAMPREDPEPLPRAYNFKGVRYG